MSAHGLKTSDGLLLVGLLSWLFVLVPFENCKRLSYASQGRGSINKTPILTRQDDMLRHFIWR